MELTAKKPLPLDPARLPSLPHVLLRILEACNDPDTSTADIAQVIGADSGLTARLMTLARSASYSRADDVKSIDKLLLVLGLDAVKTTAISAAIYEVFTRVSENGVADLKVFWRHALLCASLARDLARLKGYPLPEEAYLAGLLHDIGELMLKTAYPKEYAQIASSGLDGASLLAEEHERFGFNHCELGARLVEEWHLQSFMSDALLFHHEAAARLADGHLLIKIIHGANSLADWSAAGADGAPDEGVSTLLGLPQDQLADIARAGRQAVEESAQAFDLDPRPAPAGNGAGPAASADRRRNRAAIAPDNSRESAAHDELKRVELSRAVRDLAILSTARQYAGEPDTFDEILTSFERCAAILFGLDGALRLVLDPGRAVLLGSDTRNPGALINQLAVPAEAGSSLPGKALASGKLVSSMEDAPADGLHPLDRQLVRLAGKEGIVCFPLRARSETFGVMVFAVDAALHGNLLKREKLALNLGQMFSQMLMAARGRESGQGWQGGERGLGDYVRKLAHEANNPLAVMKSYVEMMAGRPETDDALKDDLRVIDEEISRVSALISRLVSGAATATDRSGTGEVEVNELVEGVFRTCKISLFDPRQIVAELDLAPQPILVNTKKDALKQILLNLFKNAAEAMPDGGMVAVSSRDNINQDGRHFVEITIRDNGPGIPPALMGSLFQSRGSEKGGTHAGLGLPIVKDLVDDIKGHIICASELEKGTVFRILLPQTPSRPEFR